MIDFSIFSSSLGGYSIGSECPFPLSAKATTAIAIATPIAAPYAAMDASAML